MKYEKFKISYHEYGLLLKILYEQIVDFYNCDNLIDFVYGFPRGGLPIAVHFSHWFNAKMIMTLDEVFKNVEDNKKVLVVDDIADTGKTFSRIYQLTMKYTNIITASIFFKRRSSFRPCFFSDKIPDNKWVVFPYEMDEEEPNR